MREKRRSEYKAVDTATCKSFGFKVDQPEYNQCIVNEQRYRQTQHDIDVNRMKARRAQRQQRYGYWALKAWYEGAQSANALKYFFIFPTTALVNDGIPASWNGEPFAPNASNPIGVGMYERNYYVSDVAKFCVDSMKSGDHDKWSTPFFVLHIWMPTLWDRLNLCYY